MVGKGFSNENYGIGLMKGDTAGTAAINAAIAKMIADGSWKKALEIDGRPVRLQDSRAADHQLIALVPAGIASAGRDRRHLRTDSRSVPQSHACGRRGRREGAT